MKKQIPKTVKEESVKIGNVEIIVCVLDDGRRIIEQNSFDNFINAMNDGTIEINDENANKVARLLNEGGFISSNYEELKKYQ